MNRGDVGVPTKIEIEIEEVGEDGSQDFWTFHVKLSEEGYTASGSLRSRFIDTPEACLRILGGGNDEDDWEKFPFWSHGANYLLLALSVDRGGGGETSIENVPVPPSMLDDALSEALERLYQKPQIKGCGLEVFRR